MHVLLIKMSSMGDVIHTLPALSDAMKAIPNLEVDWVVEPAFADIPAWHPAVKKIIPISLRHWRKNSFKKSTYTEIKRFYQSLREKKYDLIIDAQGLLKSAIVAKLAHGHAHGLDKNSARESISHFFYSTKYNINKNQHAVNRTRELFSKILGYTFSGNSDYQINPQKLPALDFTLPKQYLVYLHGTTWKTKHYPENYWQQLLTYAAEKNIVVYLPWGDTTEKKRAEKLADNISCARVLPKLSVAQIATLLKNATAVIAVDTGLGHLCAALSTPTISLYGPTNPKKIGTLGNNQIHLQANFACAPCASKICHYAKTHQTDIVPACYMTIDPRVVWHELKKILE
ncbi:MAG: lipopolysaccharide heptosyltransferase I [Gammaproteobacteria bacterium CG_4_10_14_0_8_um_filter_38_16]|nr:MAG: lipopolysaccharide heptosyltransferase I [Gammaproteobacteria bacterium CG_4_10_14_0_8_um_filter_38_16]PJA02941.1 MAG: lipopolysaccharide heptosyltransferase I [Gammaproteobacteria bacterium CG_4_10_14_0_2_um_filter_38_22]PJB11392.1 MAG: lipopolysaccharide heptosyltransferase I [Gammaproteobacteria bacterium CG_4_9_14_3_um_filter_38_9]